MNEKVQTMLKAGQGSEAEKLIPQINKLNENSLKCSASLMEKYGADTQLDTKQISSVMSTTCPKIYKEIGSALFEELQ